MNIRLFNEYDILYPSCNFLTCMVCFARDVLKLKEAIRIKEAEGDAYISDIEVSSFFSFLSAVYVVCMHVWKHMILSLQTIGQAYEDMQTQNQHLLQQVADRDDFNIKVFIYFPLHLIYHKTANS